MLILVLEVSCSIPCSQPSEFHPVVLSIPSSFLSFWDLEFNPLFSQLRVLFHFSWGSEFLSSIPVFLGFLLPLFLQDFQFSPPVFRVQVPSFYYWDSKFLHLVPGVYSSIPLFSGFCVPSSCSPDSEFHPLVLRVLNSIPLLLELRIPSPVSRDFKFHPLFPVVQCSKPCSRGSE